jgi:hypothetical protein
MFAVEITLERWDEALRTFHRIEARTAELLGLTSDAAGTAASTEAEEGRG